MLIVFGSLNIDLSVVVDSLPKAGETILTNDYGWAPGGKGGNQAVAAARAGARVAMVSMLGDDGFGKRLRDVFRREGIISSGVGRSEHPTGTAFIALDKNGENQIIVASGANVDVMHDQVPDEILNDRATLLCQMEVRPEQSFQLIERAKNLGVRTILNLAPVAPMPVNVLQNLDVLILNEGESEQLAQQYDCANQDILARAQAIAAKGPAGLTCIITCGEKGVAAASQTEQWQVPAIPLEKVIDSTGAGDAFCGYVAAWLHSDRDIKEAILAGICAGALACVKRGAQDAMPHYDDVAPILEKLKAKHQ